MQLKWLLKDIPAFIYVSYKASNHGSGSCCSCRVHPGHTMFKHRYVILSRSCILPERPQRLLFSTFHSNQTLQLLMTSLHWSLNRISYPHDAHHLFWRSDTHSLTVHQQLFVTHCAISSQMAAMATLKIAPVNRSENIRWLSAAVCPPTTPTPPPIPWHSTQLSPANITSH